VKLDLPEEIGDIDLDPRVEFDENHPNFDEPMPEMQLGVNTG